jgi:hypothetical protein
MEVKHSLGDAEWMAEVVACSDRMPSPPRRGAESASPVLSGVFRVAGGEAPAMIFSTGAASSAPASARASPTLFQPNPRLVRGTRRRRGTNDDVPKPIAAHDLWARRRGDTHPPRFHREISASAARREVSAPVPRRETMAPASEDFGRAHALPPAPDNKSWGSSSSESIETGRLRKRLLRMSAELERQHLNYAGTGYTYLKLAQVCFILTLMLSGGVAFVGLFVEEDDEAARKSATTVCGGLIFAVQSLNKYFRWEAYAKTYETAARKLFRIHDEIKAEMSVGAGLENGAELLARARDVSREIRENTDYIPWTPLRGVGVAR